MRSRLALRTVALGYLALILILPIGLIFFRTFEDGLGKSAQVKYR